MPVKNIVKYYGEGSYYHAYNRGVNKEAIFHSPDDFAVFLSLFKRHLSKEPKTDKYGRQYVHYLGAIDLIAFCLMKNHFHLLVYLKERSGLEDLMRSTMTAYSMYFNKKYDRVGSLFQNHFLATRIDNDPYFWHISRYIHLNPAGVGENSSTYQYSSLPYFIGEKVASWLHPEHIIQTKQDQQSYSDFVNDVQSAKKEAADIQQSLAGTNN